MSLCPPDVRNALLHFKNSSMLDSMASDSCYTSYPKTNSWNNDVDCCSWDNVGCDYVTSNVIKLILACSWLHGALHSNSSPLLLLLHHLWMLDLSQNDLAHFHIPHNLSAIPKTTYQNLSHSTFPLQWVWLTSCNLTEFPYFLYLLKRLMVLDLSRNRISGEIPKWFREISHDTLDSLDLSHNFLDGGIQQMHSKSFSLWSLNLSNNNLSGNIPVCFGNITDLKRLDLGGNKSQGPLLCSLVKHINLETLLLGYREIAKQVQVETRLTLEPDRKNRVGWVQGPIQTWSASHLVYLDLRSNKFHDLAKNKFGGQIPLPSPVTFYYSIASNNITGNIPSLICNATNLEFIDLSNDGLTDSLSRCITNFSIDLSSLIKCKSLEVLDLSNNHIEDTFSRSLGTLLKLKVLILRSNNFKDLLDIPKGVHIFLKLHILDLSNNNFSDIPEAFGHLCSLIGLNLSHNHLTGSIPLTLGNLTKLEWLDLSSNKLRGGIPRVLRDLAFLGYLNLSKNQLIGRIPQDKQLITFSSGSFNGNLSLCGTPLPKACPGNAQFPPPSSSST
ncbi:hypothetical protein EUGRSUZ_F00570 [Eucalyptus grandis]|uniref:Uncharacterized protein n=2 Tax=Eucalyptus grandis TaxID=71139 RepID=A0ACC3KDJ9_EUCGR|nr:hypothetical protein EUGRSUZ_F00570 [Eucalyptus grandis]